MQGKTLLITALGCSLVGCATDAVRLRPAGIPNARIVEVDGTKVGVYQIQRPDGKVVGHVNEGRTWLVVEDGAGGDSYPEVTAYRIAGSHLAESLEMERIKREHYASPDSGPVEPVFLGFGATGKPNIASATGLRSLSE